MSLRTVQERRAEMIGESPKFTVTTSVIDKGPLPTGKIFVLQVTETGDPSLDQLVRIASIADFEAIGGSREESIRTGVMFFRSTQFRQVYDAVDVANLAAKVTKDRIDTLVNSWVLFDEEFEGSEETEHPRLDEGVLAELIQKFIEARDKLEEVRQERDDALEELAMAKANAEAMDDKCATLADLVQTIIILSGLCDDADEVLANFEATQSSFGVGGSGNPGVGAALGSGVFTALNLVWYNLRQNMNMSGSPYTIPVASFNSVEGEFFAAWNTLKGIQTQQYAHPFTAVLTSFATRPGSGEALAAREVCQIENAESKQELTKAQLVATEKQGEVEALQSQEDKALKEVTEACPKFDPTQV